MVLHIIVLGSLKNKNVLFIPHPIGVDLMPSMAFLRAGCRFRHGSYMDSSMRAAHVEATVEVCHTSFIAIAAQGVR